MIVIVPSKERDWVYWELETIRVHQYTQRTKSKLSHKHMLCFAVLGPLRPDPSAFTRSDPYPFLWDWKRRSPSLMVPLPSNILLISNESSVAIFAHLNGLTKRSPFFNYLLISGTGTSI